MLAQALALRLGFVLVLLTVLGMIAAPLLCRCAGPPGFYGPERQEAIYLLRICLPYTLAAGMAALGMALLHSLGVFWLPAVSPALFNIVILLFAVAAGLGLPPHQRWPWACCAAALPSGLPSGWRTAFAAASACSGAERRQRSGQAALRTSAASLAWECLGRLPAGLLGASAPQLAMLAACRWRRALGVGRLLPCTMPNVCWSCLLGLWVCALAWPVCLP